jgi:HEAT repeat protein
MSRSSIPQSLSRLIQGDPATSMEIAKRIIGGDIRIDHNLLAQIATDKSIRKWPRIAAIYALGFVGEDKFVDTIRKILADATDDVLVRSHVAEALGNLRDKCAVPLLQDVLNYEPPPELSESCSYALNELGAAG